MLNQEQGKLFGEKTVQIDRGANANCKDYGTGVICDDCANRCEVCGKYVKPDRDYSGIMLFFFLVIIMTLVIKFMFYA